MAKKFQKTQQTRITESLSGSSRVDRESGVIRGVKLIGFESRNGRYYPPETLKRAVSLYEGARVNVDHPQNGPAQPRSYADRLGVIKSARFVEGQGIFGDFHFNPKHPVAEQMLWDAENRPEILGFSHNALMRFGAKSGGREVIEEIVSVRSVDLVADPATTQSLYESEEAQMEIDQPTPQTADDAVKDAFRQMVIAALDDGTLDMKGLLARIKGILQAKEKLMGGPVTKDPEPKDEPADEPGEESVKLQEQVKQLQQKLEQYESEKAKAALVASIDAALVTEGLDPKNPQHVSELFSGQLLATEDESIRLAMIKDRAAILGAKRESPQGSGQPAYMPPTAATESLDTKAIVARLRS